MITAKVGPQIDKLLTKVKKMQRQHSECKNWFEFGLHRGTEPLPAT